MDDNEARLIRLFEKQGEHLVRLTLQSGGYSSPSVSALAAKWLAQKDQEREEREGVSNSENNRIARQARTAAIVAAIAAIATIMVAVLAWLFPRVPAP